MKMKSIPVFGPKLFLLSPNNLFSVSKVSCFPLTSLPTKPPKPVRLKAITTLNFDHQESDRTFRKLLPSPWTDHFHSVDVDVSEMDAVRKEIDELKTKVKNKLMFSQGIDSAKERILMIYLVKSLGLAYHFEDEIYETLKEDFKNIEEMMAGEEDLYSVSIIFWVLRTYGHYISSDVFRRFKGRNGNFKESLKDDAKGMLSLYEAAHMRTTKDHILDEALSFTSSHLESLSTSGMCPLHLSMRIQNALTLSQRWNMEMVTALEYIETYEKEEGHEKMILKYAKLSFKLGQLQYIQDLKIITKWYKDVDFASNLPPYFKDRIVENNFFIQAVFFEPHVSKARIMCSKCFTLIGILDDTLDRYASLPEVESLVNSLERWAPVDAMDEQHGYLKFVLNFIFDTFKEIERELSPEEKSYGVKATIEEIKILAKSHCDLAKWVNAAHVPSFEEYMKVGEVETAVHATLASLFMCMGNVATKEDYEWIKSRPKLAQSIAFRLRLVNDIYGFEDDISRGYITNAVNCYMKQYGVTKQEAIRELKRMVTDADKTTNEELLTTTCVSRLFLNATMGLAKMISLCFNGHEGFTYPEGRINDYMTSILVNKIRP